MANRVPKYRQVYASLREDIESGRWPEGALLPTEAVLSKSYNVSRITVREALQLLVNERFVTRRQGQGTIVANRTPLPGNCFVSFTDQILQLGYKLRTVILDVHVLRDDERTDLSDDLSQDEEIVMVERLRIVNDKPFLIGRAYLPHRLVSGIGPNTFAETGPRQSMVYTLDKIFGIKIVNAKEVISALLLEDRLASLLQVPPGEAAIRQVCHSYNALGELVMSDEFVTLGPIEIDFSSSAPSDRS